MQSLLFGSFLVLLVYEGHTKTPPVTNSTLYLTQSVGDHVTLHCEVGFTYNVLVAWINEGEEKLLSLQDEVITRDRRISVQRNGNQTWCLTIHHIRQEDSGLYACVTSADFQPVQHKKFYLQVEGKILFK
ncbi:neural cell adhesion molecule 1-B-like [Tachypleus tridentatus]|uniref:neural cell adhesion molecule 1-B-like n=1 Tax=Tachypleus tridentatus TaxID=6853 RepID=UPI003FD23206